MTRQFRGACATVATGLMVAALGAVALAQTGPAASAVNTLTPAERQAGWTLLFNGTSLDNWRAYGKADVAGTRWKVDGGLLCLGPKDGTDTHGGFDIISRDTFDQFELAWDWRVAQGANSGLKYFVLEDQKSAIGHEYQLIDDERHADAKVGPERQTAAFYDVLAPTGTRPVKPAGEWNSSRVLVKGKTVEHWLNGTKVLTYELESDAVKKAVIDSKFKGNERFGKLHKAHILLQDHGDAVCFRNVKVRSTAAGAAKTSQ